MKSIHGLLCVGFFLGWLLLSSGCVKHGLPINEYPMPDLPPIKAVSNLTVSVDSELTDTANQQQAFASRFASDLNKSRMFRRVSFQTPNSDILFKTVVTYSGPVANSEPVLVWSTISPIYFPLALLGAPSDWADSGVSLSVTAVLPGSGETVMEWFVMTTRRGHAGFYYHQWPGGRALRAAVEEMLEKISLDTPKLEAQIRVSKGAANHTTAN